MSMSDAIKKKWQDPVYREKMSLAIKKRNADPNYRKSIGEKVKALWKNDYGRSRREKMSESSYRDSMSKSLKVKWKDGSYREKMLDYTKRLHSNVDYLGKLRSISSELWRNEQYVEKCRGGIIKSIEKQSELSKDRWKNDEYKNRVVAAIRTRSIDPVWREKFLQIINSEENRRKRAMARQRSAVGRTIVSRPQQIVMDKLNDLGVDFIPEYQIGFYNFDIFIPSRNILIEVQGDYWHNLEKTKKNDRGKSTYINRYFQDYKLKYIWEHEIKCVGKVEEQLRYWLGLDRSPQRTFDFNDISVSKIDTNIADSFLSRYHYLCGVGRNAFSIGAFLHDKLIAVCCFSSVTRKETATSLGLKTSQVRELSRFCIMEGYHFKNFASWFLSRSRKFFLSESTTKVLIAFADRTFNHYGTIYKADNWILDKKVKPGYWYVSKDGFVMHKKTLWDHAKSLRMTESSFAEIYGYQKVTGLSKDRFVFMT